MKVCAIHVSWAYGELLGRPAKVVDEPEACRAGARAAACLPGLVASLGQGCDRVLLCLDAQERGWRRDLDAAHSEAHVRWPAAAWRPLRVAAAELGHNDGFTVVTAPPYLPGTLLPLGEDPSGDGPDYLDLSGRRAAGRDVVATIARWWAPRPLECTECAGTGDGELSYNGNPDGDQDSEPCDACGGQGRSVLRIVSGRTSLVPFADASAGIELVRSFRQDGDRGWTWAVSHPAELAAELGPLDLLTHRRALRELGGIGDEPRKPKVNGAPTQPSTAHALLLGAGGDCRVAVANAALVAPGDRLPGLTAPQMDTLRAAAAHGGAGILRALALVEARADVPMDVGALLRLEGGDDGQGNQSEVRDLRADVGSPLRWGAAHGAHQQREAPESSGGSGAGVLEPGGARDGAAESGAPLAPGLSQPVAPAPCLSHLCDATHTTDETCAAAATREQAARLAALAATPREPADHDDAVSVTRCDGQQESAHTPGADMARQEPPSMQSQIDRDEAATEARKQEMLRRHRDTKPETTKETATMPPPIDHAPNPQPSPTYDNDTGEEQRPAAPLAMRQPDAAPLARREPVVAPLAAAQPAAPAMMSDDTGELWRAMGAAQLEFTEVKKARPVFQRDGVTVRYYFANLSDLVSAVQPALKKHGFVTSHIARGNRLHVRLIHTPTGQWIEGVLPFVAPTVNGPEGVQALGSLLTYLRRYLLSMLLGVVAVDDDDDGDSAQQSRGRA